MCAFMACAFTPVDSHKACAYPTGVIKDARLVAGCMHRFCGDCIEKWLRIAKCVRCDAGCVHAIISMAMCVTCRNCLELHRHGLSRLQALSYYWLLFHLPAGRMHVQPAEPPCRAVETARLCAPIPAHRLSSANDERSLQISYVAHM